MADKFTEPFLKPLFTEIEKNNCFSIIYTHTRSDLSKLREETIKKYELIDGSNHDGSLQNFKTWQFTSLSLRKKTA